MSAQHDRSTSPHADGLNINDASTWPEFLSTTEVAAILRTTRDTVVRRMREGHLPSVNLLGQNAKRIPKAALLALLNDPPKSSS